MNSKHYEVTLTPAEIAANTILTGTTRRFVTNPARLLNPTTAALIRNYFPDTSVNAAINAANGRLVNYFENVPARIYRHLGTVRVDHELTAKDKLWAVYSIQPREQATNPVQAPYAPLGLVQVDQTNHPLSLSDTFLIW